MFAAKYDTLSTLKDARWARDQLNRNSLVHYEEIVGDHFSFVVGSDMSYFSESVIPLINKYHP